MGETVEPHVTRQREGAGALLLRSAHQSMEEVNDSILNTLKRIPMQQCASLKLKPRNAIVTSYRLSVRRDLLLRKKVLLDRYF